MKKTFFISGLVALVFLGYSCASMNIATKFDKNVNFSEMKSFAWHPDIDVYVKKLNMDDQVDAYIRNSIEDELKKKEMAKVSVDKAQFLVVYNALVEVKSSMDTQEAYPDYPIPWNWDVDYGRDATYTYEVGTLAVDFIQNSTKSAFWRGTAQAQVNRSEGFDKKIKLINKAIKKVMKEFPPEK